MQFRLFASALARALFFGPERNLTELRAVQPARSLSLGASPPQVRQTSLLIVGGPRRRTQRF